MWNRNTDRLLAQILQELKIQTELLEKLVPSRPASVQVNFGKPTQKEK
jgi:hypothetical protein